MENLRDVQLLEAQHAKERFEMEMVSFEELESKKIHNHGIKASTKLKHMSELHTEKEVVMARKEAEKEQKIIEEQSREISRLLNQQRKDMQYLKGKLDET